MSEVEISVGGRSFSVACQPGEEEFLQAAAKQLDAEASVLVGQLGNIPEAQMLLMAGLMLADKLTAVEDRLKRAQNGKPAAAEPPPPELPDGFVERMEKLASEAEELARVVGEMAG